MSDLPPLPSVEYLLTCSEQDLGSIELAALDRQAQLLKAATNSWKEASRQGEVAGVCRWLLLNRNALLDEARRTVDVQTVLTFPRTERKHVA